MLGIFYVAIAIFIVFSFLAYWDKKKIKDIFCWMPVSIVLTMITTFFIFGISFLILFPFLNNKKMTVEHSLSAISTKSENVSQGSIFLLMGSGGGTFNSSDKFYLYYIVNTKEGNQIKKTLATSNNTFIKECSDCNPKLIETWSYQEFPDITCSFLGVEKIGGWRREKSVFTVPNGSIEKKFNISLE